MAENGPLEYLDAPNSVVDFHSGPDEPAINFQSVGEGATFREGYDATTAHEDGRALTVLMAAASVELVEPSLSGTASGLLNCAQYVGSGSSTLIAGAAIEWLGPDALFASLTLGAGLSTVGMARVMWLQHGARALEAPRRAQGGEVGQNPQCCYCRQAMKVNLNKKH